MVLLEKYQSNTLKTKTLNSVTGMIIKRNFARNDDGGRKKRVDFIGLQGLTDNGYEQLLLRENDIRVGLYVSMKCEKSPWKSVRFRLIK